MFKPKVNLCHIIYLTYLSLSVFNVLHFKFYSALLNYFFFISHGIDIGYILCSQEKGRLFGKAFRNKF